MSKETKTVEPKKTTADIAREKAAALTLEYKAKGVSEVHPIVFKIESTGEEIVGYYKEPSRDAKMAVMDKALMGAFSTVREILPIVFIPEHSDARFMSEDQEHDDIFMGFVMEVYNRIKFKTNAAKKK